MIGGGVGGLAAAIHLAHAGVQVELLERAATVGGKLREVELDGQRLLAGPSVFTMRWVFDELFDGRLADALTLLSVDPLCRHFFADGSVLDLYADEARSKEAIARFAGAKEAEAYLRYRRHAAKIFEIVRGPFMENEVPSLMDFMSPRTLWQLLQIDGMRTLWRALEEYFTDPRLRQLFGRYATYNGSSPYHAPATLAVIMHVENAFGIFAVKGGIVRLAEALRRRAESLGVSIVTGAEVDQILVEPAAGPGAPQRARGVRSGQRTLYADCIIANCDVADALERLLPEAAPVRKLAHKYGEEELSLSAYVHLALAPPPPLELLHHNVFFGGDYAREFEELVTARRPPSDPTVYVCSEAPGRYFFLTNAPPLDAKGAAIDWTTERPRCRARLYQTLARHGFHLTPTATHEITPPDFAAAFPRSRGALYGLASNSRLAAFKRPANRLPNIDGLYFCGGTVHPGAGLPMVALSAKIATRRALADLG